MKPKTVYQELFCKDYLACIDTEPDVEEQEPEPKPYWHELTKEQREIICASKEVTVGQVIESYKQPDWCCYFEALEGVMGCWSLMFGYINKEADCVNCELYTTDPENKVFE